mgnify:FL=1
MSGCKFNQNMESGDIIYLILLVFFMILGFFNDSRKKKNQQKQQSEKPSHPYFDLPSRPFFETSDSDMEAEDELPSWFESRPAVKPRVATPPPPVVRAEEGKSVFQSSMNLTTDFAKESSLKSSIFVYDADASYDNDPDMIDMAETADSQSPHKPADGKKRGSLHPILAGLYGDTSRDELLKGLIIGDIVRRKY